MSAERQRPAVSPALAVVGMILVTIALVFLSLVFYKAPAKDVMMEATIIGHIEARFQNQIKTLVEYENGEREILPYYYGEPGDVFMVRRRGAYDIRTTYQD